MISTAHSPRLAARFGQNTFVIRSETPLAEDQMRRAAPSIFAEGKHGSRSERYTYIPTIDVLRGLRREGFEPFMVAQSKSRIEGKTEFTKHMIRMRHAGQVNTRPEANEIILINSHDGASSYQMLAGVFRFVCCNGLVVGDVANDIRIPHKGNIQDEVIEGAFRVPVVQIELKTLAVSPRRAMQQIVDYKGDPGNGYTGVISVSIDDKPFTKTWWNFSGDTVTDFSPAAKSQFGTWDTRYDDEEAAWRHSHP